MKIRRQNEKGTNSDCFKLTPESAPVFIVMTPPTPRLHTCANRRRKEETPGTKKVMLQLYGDQAPSR